MSRGSEGDPARFRKYEREGAYHWDWIDRSSPRYAPAAEARYTRLRQSVGDAARVLDLGCGDGALMGLVDREGRLTVGVEPEWSGACLSASRLDDHRACPVIAGRGEELPFHDGTFDAVLLADVIEHLDDPEPTLSEARRVLRRGGRLVVTTPRRLPNHSWDPENHVREYSAEELASTLGGHFGRVDIAPFISLRWWRVRKRLGKVFVRLWSRWFFNPFFASGRDPERFCHLLATCRKET